jgi:hypothetical protein
MKPGHKVRLSVRLLLPLEQEIWLRNAHLLCQMMLKTDPVTKELVSSLLSDEALAIVRDVRIHCKDPGDLIFHSEPFGVLVCSGDDGDPTYLPGLILVLLNRFDKQLKEVELTWSFKNETNDFGYFTGGE